MRFVHYQQVPLCIAKMLKTLLAAAYKIEGADHQLFGLKRVVCIVLRFGIAFIVEQGEAQIEATQHLHQPLVLQGLRHHNQHTFRCAREQLLMQDHPGFNGFPETDLIRQQHAWRIAATHIVSDVQLMRDQVSTLAAQAAPRHTVLRALIAAGAKTQRKTVHTVNLPGKQAILWFAEYQFTVEQHFAQDNVVFLGIQTRSGVGKQSVSSFTSSIVNCQPSWLVTVSPGLNMTRVTGESLRA
jgi:hypothetical protein